MRRPQPSLPLLSIPQGNLVEQWLDKFDPSPIEEQVEYSLNLGAESPVSVEEDTILSLPPQRKFTRRPRPGPRRQEAVDRDCGICFEYSVQPTRTLCCGKVFCREHLADWLSGPSSDGRCPSCSAPCSSTNILSPTLSIKPAASQTLHPGASLNSLNPSPRHRSQSASTNATSVSSSGSEQSSITTTTTSSISPSTLCLSPAPELIEDPREHDSNQPWLAPALTFPSLATLAHSPEEAREINRSSTVEALSRLVSVLGLTVLFYALLASS